MRKILLTISVLLIGYWSMAQTYTPVIGRWQYDYIKVLSGLQPPQDTLSTALTGSIAAKGAVLYVKLSNGTWSAITGAGGNGVWGFVTGDITTQTDLQTQFGTKYDTSIRKVDTLYAITDSTFGFFINHQFHTFKARGATYSFMGRSGAITLTQQDVDSALGYVPSQLPNVANSLQVINNGNTKSWQTGIYSARPAAGNFGSYYTATDSLSIYFDNGISWVTISKSAVSVPSVFGRTGNVVADSGDYNKSQVGLANVLNSLQIVNIQGTPSASSDSFANRPAAGTIGRLFISIDTKEVYRDNGSSWDKIGSGASGGVTTYAALTDVNLTSLINGQLAQYNSSSGRWVNVTPTNALVGLGNVPNVDATNAANISNGTLPAARIGTGSIDLTTKVTGPLPDGNIASAANWNAKYGPSDTAGNISTRAYRQKLADSLAGIIATKQPAGTYYSPSDTAGNISTRTYRQKGLDSLSGIIAQKKNLSDSAATNPAGFTTQSSRQKLSDSLNALIQLRLAKYDTAAGPNESYVTWASRQKLADSLVNLISLRRLISDTGTVNSPATRGWLYKVADSLAALISGSGSDSGFAVQMGPNAGGAPIAKIVSGAARFIRGDSSATNPGGIVTQASRQKLADSVNALIAKKVANEAGMTFLGAGAYSGMPAATLGQGLYYTTDSLTFYYSNGTTWTKSSFNLLFHNSGRRGDSLATTSGGNTVVFPKFIDSVGMCLHHLVNADSTWTWYVDSACMVTWPHLGKVRDSLLALIAGKQASGSYVTNAGNAPSIQTGILSSRPSASSCANCFYGSTTDSTWYFSDGTAWSPMGKGSAGGGTPAGSTHSVQSNGGSGVFEATPNFVTNPTTHTVSADTLSTLKLQADSIRLVNFPLFINGVTTATMVGDSYLACVRPDGPDTCITTRIAAGYSILENNIAVGGTGLARMDSVFYHSVNPGTGSAATLATNGAALITLGALNDFRRGGYAPKTLGKVLNGYNALFVNQFMKKFVAGGATDSHLTRYGSFATGYQGTTVYGKTSNGALSNTLNDSLVYTDTVGAAGGALFWGTIVSDSGVNKYSESVLAYVDNTLVGTYNLSHNQTDGISDGTYDNERTPAAFMYIVSPGVHHLKIINNTAHSLYVPVDMVGTLLDTASAKAIPWVLFEIPHLAEGGYLLSPSLGSDLVMNLANASLDSLRATWPAGYPTVMVKTNNYFKSWSSDSIHPNNTGDAQLFQAFSAAVTTANAGPYHILNIAGNPYWVNGSGVALPLATSASNAFIQNQTGGVQAATYNISGGAAAASMTTAATNQGAGIPLTGKAFQAGTLPGGNTFASWYTSSAPTDQKTSAWYSTTSAFNLGFWNDAGTLNTNVISIGKSGYGSGGVNFGVPVYLGTASGNGLQGLLSPNTALISFTGTVTGGLAEPFIVNANAVSGLTMQLINSNAGSGASSSLLIKSTGTGQISSPTIDWNAAGTDFFAGQDASTNTFKINTGAPAGNGFGAGTNLLTFLGNGKLGLGGITNPWALLSLPGATTSAASLNIPAGNQPTTAHPGDFYRDTTTGNLWMYLAGAWSQISNQTSGASGVVHVGTLDSVTANAKGGSIVGASYYNQSATASFPGLVNITSQSFAGLKTFTNGLSALTIQTGATYCVALGTSFVAGSGAGTSPTVTTSLTDMGGQITITTGSTPSANAALITITYQNEYPNASFPTLTAGNAAAAALTGPNQVYPGTVTQAAFTINTGSIALAGSTTYTWYYHVTGY